MANFGCFATLPVFDSEQLILPMLQLFQYFPTKVVPIDSEWPILAVLQLVQYFLPKWSKLIQNGQFWP